MSEKTKEPSWALRIAIGGPVLLALVYVLSALIVRPSAIGDFGSLGDAFAPLTVAFSIAAVAVALRSVELQRQELRLQRLELRETREEMKAQREEFEKTAQAQADLALSQRRLADAQEQANRLSLEATLAQYASSISTLQAARVQIDVDRMNGRRNPGAHQENIEGAFKIPEKVSHLEAVVDSLVLEHGRVLGMRSPFAGKAT